LFYLTIPTTTISPLLVGRVVVAVVAADDARLSSAQCDGNI